MIGFAGRLIPGKGVDILLRACAELRTPASWRLDVAGDGPLRGSFETLADVLGIAHRVRFLGWVDNMPSFWTGCRIAVVPSYEWVESFGLVAIEAMASGLPVVASRRGGLAEVVADGVTGRLFEAGDSHQLAVALEAYLENQRLREQHGDAGRERCAARFDIDGCSAAFVSLLRRLRVARHRDAAPGGGA